MPRVRLYLYVAILFGISLSLVLLGDSWYAVILALAGLAGIAATLRIVSWLVSRETMLEAVLSAAANPIVVIDWSGTIEFASSSVEQVFGWTADELVGRNISSLMEDTVAADHDAHLARAKAKGATRATEIFLRSMAKRRDGTTFPCSVSIGRVQDHSNALLGSIQDISNFSVTEDELRALAREAQAAQAAQSAFLANVSHELRTPLTSIIAYSEMMTIGDAAERSSNIDEFAGIVLSEAYRMNRLVDELLESATIHHGKFVIDPVRFDVRQMAARTVQLACPHAGSSARVEFVCDEIEPVMICADRDKIQQVVANLIGNACKFTPTGERVLCCLDRVEAGARIRVRDSGPGVPDEHLEDVFDRFFQVGGRDPLHKTSGFGLGLNIARELVEAHGGSIGVANPPGGGAEFSVILPWPAVESAVVS